MNTTSETVSVSRETEGKAGKSKVKRELQPAQSGSWSLAGSEDSGLRLCGTTMAGCVRTANRVACAYSPAGSALCVSHTVKLSRDTTTLSYSFKIFIDFYIIHSVCACVPVRRGVCVEDTEATAFFFFLLPHRCWK